MKNTPFISRNVPANAFNTWGVIFVVFFNVLVLGWGYKSQIGNPVVRPVAIDVVYQETGARVSAMVERQNNAMRFECFSLERHMDMPIWMGFQF